MRGNLLDIFFKANLFMVTMLVRIKAGNVSQFAKFIMCNIISKFFSDYKEDKVLSVSKIDNFFQFSIVSA